MHAFSNLVGQYDWIWPICEILHFLGVILLVGIVGLIDLRVLGVGRQLPLASLHRLIPWAISGFLLCFMTGLVFVLGDPFKIPADTLTKTTFQLKMLFIVLGGINALLFEYLTDFKHPSQGQGVVDRAPYLIKVMAGISLFVWLTVVYLGRMLPYGDSFYFVFYW